MKRWLWKVLVAADVFWNVVFNGYPDETISARAATARRDGKRWGCILCKWLESFDPGHCDNAIQSDEQRAAAAVNDLKG